MSFWSKAADANQIRHKFAFKVEISDLENYQIYYAKSVDKPSIVVKPITLKYLYSHEVKFPGRPSWNPIKLTLYNVGPNIASGKDLITGVQNILNSNGYDPPDEDTEVNWFVSKFNFKDDYKLDKVAIHQIDTTGKTAELWTLKNPFIIDFRYDTLDYSTEGPTMIDLTIAYDWATLG